MAARERTLFDDGWRFKLADPSESRLHTGRHGTGGCRWGAAGWKVDDSQWRTVDLPHDFVVEREFIPEHGLPELDHRLSDTYHGSRPGGVAWYRKKFGIPEGDLGRRVYLQFDGIYRDSRVYLNECYVGAQPSGYSSSSFDVTDLLEYGGENLLAVRVDATEAEGWWYEGGGIYRHVWLVKASPVHVAPWGTFVSAEVHLGGPAPRGRLRIQTSVLNRTAADVRCLVRSSVLDPGGSQAAETETSIDVPVAGQAEAVQEIEIQPARLWSLDEPNLYKVLTALIQDDQVVDRYETVCGIRSVRFDAEQGFFLNEQPVKIKGVCCHQDHAGVGIAMPDRLLEYRMQKLKEMGCNAYRSSHHPPTPELLDLCDRLGMLVMDENRLLSSASEDVSQLEAMVRRDRNHPCVILWSLGNEETTIQWKPQSALITRSLKSRLKALDPTRPVTLAICYWNPVLKGDEPLTRTPYPAAELDVMGFNYAPQNWLGYHELHPGQPCVVSEASASHRTRGCYVADPERCHVAWADPSALPEHEEQWQLVAENPFLSGTFLWTAFDYRGEPTPTDRWPAVSSHTGFMDACGFPKDNYYYYRSWWSAAPVLHLFPHWNWPERRGQPIKVYCYSNCDEVELFLNGQGLGRKAMVPHRHLEWDNVIYEPGVLQARGYREGAIIASARVETTGAPHSLRLTPDRRRICADSRDIAVVTVEVVDEQGRTVPTADNDISFRLEGAGAILGTGNGNPSSHEPDKGSARRAFNGLCQVIIQSGDQAGRLTLSAHSPNLLPTSITIEAG